MGACLKSRGRPPTPRSRGGLGIIMRIISSSASAAAQAQRGNQVLFPQAACWCVGLLLGRDPAISSSTNTFRKQVDSPPRIPTSTVEECLGQEGPAAAEEAGALTSCWGSCRPWPRARLASCTTTSRSSGRCVKEGRAVHMRGGGGVMWDGVGRQAGLSRVCPGAPGRSRRMASTLLTHITIHPNKKNAPGYAKTHQRGEGAGAAGATTGGPAIAAAT